jgi:hypothetical protein
VEICTKGTIGFELQVVANLGKLHGWPECALNELGMFVFQVWIDMDGQTVD